MKTQSNNCGFDYCPPDFVDQENGDVETSGQWRREVARVQGMVQLNNQGSNNYARIAKDVRDSFKEYLYSAQGSVPWQGGKQHNKCV